MMANTWEELGRKLGLHNRGYKPAPEAPRREPPDGSGGKVADVWTHTPDRRDLFRTGDPETSEIAAKSLTEEKIRTSQHEVWSLLRECGPMTDGEIAEAAERAGVSQSPSGLRTRRAELVRKMLVADSGERKVLPSGRQSIVWEAIGTVPGPEGGGDA